METDQNTLSQLRVDVGELKGIMNTMVLSHGEQLRSHSQALTQLRTDLTAVKNEANRDLNEVSKVAEATKNNLAAVKEDVGEIKTRQNGAATKVFQVVSPLAAVGALIWSFIVGSR